MYSAPGTRGRPGRSPGREEGVLCGRKRGLPGFPQRYRANQNEEAEARHHDEASKPIQALGARPRPEGVPGRGCRSCRAVTRRQARPPRPAPATPARHAPADSHLLADRARRPARPPLPATCHAPASRIAPALPAASEAVPCASARAQAATRAWPATPTSWRTGRQRARRSTGVSVRRRGGGGRRAAPGGAGSSRSRRSGSAGVSGRKEKPRRGPARPPPPVPTRPRRGRRGPRGASPPCKVWTCFYESRTPPYTCAAAPERSCSGAG